MQTLLKMESNTMKRSSIDRARKLKDKLTFNMDLISISKMEVKAGKDNRNENLHPCSFLPAPVCAAKELWLHAREVLGPAGCHRSAASTWPPSASPATSPAAAESRSTSPGQLLSPSSSSPSSTWPAG
jgi:hypothetical protein